MKSVKALDKEISALKKQLDEQESMLRRVQESRDLDRSVEYLSQVFLTREEYPAFREMANKLTDFEKRLKQTEQDLKDQVNVIEADAVEQRKLIEKVQRRSKIGNFGILGQALSTLASFSNKKGSWKRK